MSLLIHLNVHRIAHTDMSERCPRNGFRNEAYGESQMFRVNPGNGDARTVQRHKSFVLQVLHPGRLGLEHEVALFGAVFDLHQGRHTRDVSREDVAANLVTDIQNGYFDRLMTTPVSRRALLLGHMLADFVLVIALSIPVIEIGIRAS